MARLKPRKNLIDLKNKFSQKNSLSEFKRLYFSLGEEMNNYSSDEKLKGGEYETMIAELTVLNRIIDEYKSSHVEYTGRANSSRDGILYFNEKTQNVEIVTILDKEKKKKRNQICSYRTKRHHTLSTPGVSLTSVMKKHDFSEDQARKYLTRSPMNRQSLPEGFLYKEIISVLERKGDEKYKDFWLLISYSTLFYTQFLSDREIRNFVLIKIQSEKDELVCLIRKIFKKIIFVPLNKFTSVPFNKGLGDHQIFEWNV